MGCLHSWLAVCNLQGVQIISGKQFPFRYLEQTTKSSSKTSNTATWRVQECCRAYWQVRITIHLSTTPQTTEKKKANLSPTEHRTHSMSPVQDLACNEERNYMKDKMLNPSQLEHLHRLFLKICKRFLWLLENWNFNWKNWAFLQVYFILFSLAELHGCLLAWLFPCWLALPLGWAGFFPFSL